MSKNQTEIEELEEVLRSDNLLFPIKNNPGRGHLCPYKCRLLDDGAEKPFKNYVDALRHVSKKCKDSKHYKDKTTSSGYEHKPKEVKPFICIKCNRRFQQKIHVERHIKIHEREKGSKAQRKQNKSGTVSVSIAPIVSETTATLSMPAQSLSTAASMIFTDIDEEADNFVSMEKTVESDNIEINKNITEDRKLDTETGYFSDKYGNQNIASVNTKMIHNIGFATELVPLQSNRVDALGILMSQKAKFSAIFYEERAAVHALRKNGTEKEKYICNNNTKTCNVCLKTVFNHHFTCAICFFSVCLNCVHISKEHEQINYTDCPH